LDKLLSIGKITNFQGLNGEVKVGYTEGDEHLLTDIDEIYAVIGSKTVKLTRENIRFHKKNAIIKFKEINSIDEAASFKGALLKAPKNAVQEFLRDDEFYIDDLVGLEAYDNENNFIGKISTIVHSKGQDLLLLKDNEGKEHIVPFVKEIVPNVSLKHKKIIVNAIEGLIESK